MGSLARRDRQPEVMDQPGLAPERHRHALGALARVNFLSATAGAFFRPLVKLQERLGTPTLRVLDVASGGGDVPIRLWGRAKGKGLDWRIAGCDVSPVAIEYAREQARLAGAEVEFFQRDVMTEKIEEEWDAIVCSLFLHHLEDEQAVMLLRAMRIAGPRLILVNDLARSWTGLCLAHVVGRVLTTSRVVHVDGPLSVRAAFTPAEARTLAERAGLAGATVRRCWPWRWLLAWRRP